MAVELLAKLRFRSGVVDHHLCTLRSFPVRHLGPDARECPFAVDSVALGESGDRDLGLDHHDPDLVDHVVPLGLEKHGGFEDDHCLGALAADARGLLECQAADLGPDDVGQSAQRIGFAEDPGAELAAVDLTVLSHHLEPECLYDLVEAARSRLVRAVTEQVRIDHCGAPLTQMTRSCGLPRCDPARESDQHPIYILPSPLMFPGPSSHTYTSQQLRLHYVDWGNEDGSPLVLVHGGRDHCRSWDWVARALRDRYHVLAPDLRGHGDSEWVRGAPYAEADYFVDLDQLLHQKAAFPVTLIGHSLGGGIVLRYAGVYPERVCKVVSVEGWTPPPSLKRELLDAPLHERLAHWAAEVREAAGRTPRRYQSLAEAEQRMRRENPHLSSEQARHLTIHGTNQNEDGTYSWKFDHRGRMFSPGRLREQDSHELWKRIRCPTLLVRGNESWASNPRETGLVGAFPDARLVNVEGAGHFVHHDRLHEFLRIVEEFL